MVDIVISALCQSTSKPLEVFTDISMKYECNIVNSHMLQLGNEIIFYGLIAGNWDGIAKLETALQSLQAENQFTIISKRTEPAKFEKNTIPFSAQIFSRDRPGIAGEVVRFFKGLNLLIVSWRSFTYTVANNETPLCMIFCQVNVPDDNNMSDLREQFLIFCDDMNFDGVIEPEKP